MGFDPDFILTLFFGVSPNGPTAKSVESFERELSIKAYALAHSAAKSYN